jgi:hypothetical protein
VRSTPQLPSCRTNPFVWQILKKQYCINKTIFKQLLLKSATHANSEQALQSVVKKLFSILKPNAFRKSRFSIENLLF